MAIDIRAVVTCSLGTLISASLSDDYIQGNGLVKCKGSCEIAGIVTPAPGTVVTFAYTKDGVTRSVPRKMRVLSSFADPFRRITKVELGCKLTYLSDVREPQKLGALCDPANASYTQADADVITLPISASSVMVQCLTELGITASSYPLTNKFSIAEFDFSPGYVQVLGDLLVSESYCGYLDYDEVLQVFSLAAEGGTGPVITSQQIIDLGGIGVGSLPAEAVLVNYSTLRLKQPDPNGGSSGDSPWDAVVTSNRYTLPISYTAPDGSQATELYNILETSTVYNLYETITTDACQPQRVLTGRLTIDQTHAAAVLGGLVSEYLSNGVAFNNAEIRKITQELYGYDAQGNETFYQREVTGPAAYLHGTAGVPWVFSATDYVEVDYVTDYPIEREQRFTNIAGSQQMVQTRVYGPWAKTIAGQQSIASARDSFTSAAQVSDYLNSAYDTRANMPLLDSRIATEKVVEGLTVPLAAEVINAKYAIGGNPNNGYRTESVAEVEVAVGSPTSKRRLELSLPYAPDDTFTKVGGLYKAVPSDAAQKANLYGRVQNKLLLGNRSGANFQLAPEVLPVAPFQPFVMQANGLSALYRNNGTSWTMDANGVVVSTDALFWGAVGGTGTFWFPVAPGVTTLPTTPPVVNGVMTVTAVAPVWNETVVATSRTRLSMEVQSLNYPLTALTEVPAQGVKVGVGIRTRRSVSPPAINVLVTGGAPVVSSGASVAVPLSTAILSAVAPAVAGGASVTVETLNVNVEAPAPEFAGPLRTRVNVPPTSVVLSAETPVVAAGASVAVGATTMTVAAVVPDSVGETPDPYFSNVSLLLHMDGSNGSTTFTDSSRNAFTVTAFGNAQVNTTTKKYGSGSALFDGNGDYLNISAASAFDLGAGDFTFEFWYYSLSVPTTTPFRRIIAHPSSNNAANTFQVWHAANATIGTITDGVALASPDGSATIVHTNAAVTPLGWCHIAFSRSSGTVRCYLNGVEKTSATNTTSYSRGGSEGIRIASRGDLGASTFIHGYIDDLRITKGVGRYTSNFTPPRGPFPNS